MAIFKQIILLILTAHLVQSNRVNVCCGPNQSYDLYTKTCARLPHSSISAVLKRNKIPASLGNYSAPLECLPNWIMVDVKINEKNFNVTNGIMNFTVGHTRYEEIILYRQQCINTIHNFPGHLIIRMCQPKSYCEENLCISECLSPKGKFFKYLIRILLDDAHVTESMREYLREDNIEYGIIKKRRTEDFIPVRKQWELTNSTVLIGGTTKKDGLKEYEDEKPLNKYCIEINGRNGIIEATLYVLKDKSTSVTGSSIVHMISTVLLCATITVYILYPKVRNSHGIYMKIFLGLYTVSFIFEFLINLNIFEGQLCIVLGFTTHVALFASYIWYSIMVINIWWNIRISLALFPQIYKFNKGKRLLSCSITIFALCFIYLQGVIIAAIVTNINSPYTPRLSKETCNFYSSIGKYYYWTSLKTIMMIVNFCLCVASISGIVEFQRTIISAENDNREQLSAQQIIYDKQLFTNLIIFCIQQFPFTVELILTILQGMYTRPDNQHNNPVELYAIEEFYSYLHAIEGILIFSLILVKPLLCYCLRRS